MTLEPVVVLPDEVVELIAKQQAIVDQANSELVHLQQATANWTAQKLAAERRIADLKAKYKTPDVRVWQPGWSPVKL